MAVVDGNPQTWNIQVRLNQASLAVPDSPQLGASDVFCQIIDERTREILQSLKISNSYKPRWHQSLFFHDVRPDDVFGIYLWRESNELADQVFSLWSADLARHAYPIGHVRINVGTAVHWSREVLRNSMCTETGMQSFSNISGILNTAADRIRACAALQAYATGIPAQALFANEKISEVRGLFALVNDMTRVYHLDANNDVRLAVLDRTFPALLDVLHGNKYKKCINFKYAAGEVKLIFKRLAHKFHSLLPNDDRASQSSQTFLTRFGISLRDGFSSFQSYLDSITNEYPTWKVDMHHVTEVFGTQRQPWDRTYRRAQKIFQTPGALAALHTEHALLYGGLGIHSVLGMENIRQKWTCETGSVLGGHEFLELINWGIRSGKPRIFTYVLMPERLYFSETGTAFTYDVASKHAVHANGAEEVVYAGEMLVKKVVTGSSQQYILVLDNNSGTYAPRKELLSLLKDVFTRNFLDLPVEVYAFDAAEMENLRSEITGP